MNLKNNIKTGNMQRMKKMPNIFVVIFVSTVFSFLPSYAGATADSNFLVDAGWLASGMHKVVIVDARDNGDYLKGRIAGAINIDVNDLQTKPDAIMFPVAQVEKILGEKGLDINSDVVLYAAGREMAYLRICWMLDYLGMHRLHVLNGGIRRMERGAFNEEVKLPSTVFKAKPDLFKIRYNRLCSRTPQETGRYTSGRPYCR